jgi:hypothetical protein
MVGWVMPHPITTRIIIVSKSSFGTAYHLLVKDFLDVTEYINPCNENKNCYSHRLYELLLRTSTEFENLCKFSFNKGKGKGNDIHPIKQKLDINDYKLLEPIWKVKDKEVGLLFWLPEKRLIKPFYNWDSEIPSLTWYQSYNKVKHNREDEFYNASLENTVLSLAGLFLALRYEFDEDIFNPYASLRQRRSGSLGNHPEHYINNSIFSIKTLNNPQTE